MNCKNKINFKIVQECLLQFLIFIAIFSPQIVGATMYLPGATLEPDCAPTSANCGVTSNIAAYFTATSTTATSTFPLLKATTAFQLGSDYLTDITGTGLSITDGVLSATGGSGANSKWATTTDATGIYLNSTANVAIGTSSPWAKLSVQNTYGSLLPLFDVSSSTSASYATTSIFRVNADGKIGIGTTTPQAKLHIVDSSSQLRLSYDMNNYFEITVASDGGTTLTANGNDPDVDININGDLGVNSSLYFNSANKSLLLNNNASTAQFEVAVPIGGTPTDLVPLMTSNTAPSGTASASTEFYLAFTAFDNNSTYWLASAGVTTGWLAYEFTATKTITKYTLTPSVNTDRAPKSWTFEGWTGSSWVILDTKSNITDWTGGVKKEFVIQNSTAYIKYRINITQNNGSGLYLAIAEMELIPSANYQMAFQVATSGNVGIGTSTPNWKLQIATTSVPQLVLSDTGAGSNLKHWTVRNSNGNLYFATSSDSYATSTISALMIDMNGNIGIATTSPWRTLSVTGTMAATALTAGAAGDYAVCINNTTKEITNAGASGCVVSSKRFKENISALDSGIDELMKLKPSKFNYIGQSGEHIGLIAEDVDTIDKRLVEYEADGITPRTVRYMEMSALLIKAIQEQQLSIEQLKQTISSSTISSQSSGFVSQGFQWVVDQFSYVFGIVFSKGKIEADKIKAKEICVGDTCVTEERFKAVFGLPDEAQGAQAGNSQSSSSSANYQVENSSSASSNQSSQNSEDSEQASSSSSNISSLSSSNSSIATVSSSSSSEAISSSSSISQSSQNSAASGQAQPPLGVPPSSETADGRSVAGQASSASSISSSSSETASSSSTSDSSSESVSSSSASVPI